jgi:hypothetical protein
LPIPGKIDTATAWPPSAAAANDKKQSPKGESKIPKLLSSSTPNKARIQLISNLVVFNEPLTPIETPEKRRINELKTKVGKCDNITEMIQILRNFLNEQMQSSESSSTNSGIFTNSLLNGTDSTVFDKNGSVEVFNILHPTQKTPPKSQTPPRNNRTSTTTTKSRTQPSTPTGSSSRLISTRRNLSVDSVNSPLSTINGKNTQTSPAKNKRMVDKATVMDVEPLDVPKLPEMISIEIQTDPIDMIKNETEKNNEEKSSTTVIPPPPPPMMIRKFNLHRIYSKLLFIGL